MDQKPKKSATEIAEALSEERKMLLYMVAMYSELEGEYGKQWLKDLSLKGLISKGIRSQVFDWDYAPASIMYRGSRKIINISQEGTTDLNYLRAIGLIARLRLGTSRHFYFNAYSVAQEALEVIKFIPEELRTKVEKLVRCMRCGELCEIIPIDPEEAEEWADYEEIDPPKEEREGGIFMVCHKCKIKINTRLDWIEDVSYACYPKWLKVRMVSECKQETCKEGEE